MNQLYINNEKKYMYLGNKKIQVIIYEKINDDGKEFMDYQTYY